MTDACRHPVNCRCDGRGIVPGPAGSAVACPCDGCPPDPPTWDIVVGVDPGLTTGVAVLNPGGPTLLGYRQLLYPTSLWEYFRSPSLHGDLPADAGDLHVHLSVETFTITGATAKLSQQTWSLRAIGFLEERADAYGWSFRQYAPAAAKRLVKDERIRELGLYRPGNDHARDALRHAVLYAVDQLGYSLIR